MARRTRAEALSIPVRVRLSPFEKQMAEQAALVNRQKFSEFIRDAVMSAAGDCLEDVPESRRRVVFLSAKSS